jgi:hypothetical protein
MSSNDLIFFCLAAVVTTLCTMLGACLVWLVLP